MMPLASDELILHRVGAVRDADKVNARPGAIAVRGGLVVAAGEEAQVRREAGKADRVIDRPDVLVLPGMVNAHAHLDLTSLGPRHYGGNFIDWVRMIMQSRDADDDAIRAAVKKGLAMSRASGVMAMGDIAGSMAALRARLFADAGHQVAGVSFLEVLGFGQRGREAVIKADAALFVMERDRDVARPDDVSYGFQPHAPYSTGAEVYGMIDPYDSMASTHLAETLEECEFIRDATGPFADLMRRLGKWDDAIRPHGVSPVEYLRETLRGGAGNWIVAHCNYVDDADIATLAATRTTVAYCPVASDYFGHRNHRYRDMIAAGVNVCLGTDSIVCQPADEPQPLGILPQMRHLYRRDRTDPALLLAMATTRGNDAMQGDDRAASLGQGSVADLIAVRFDPDDATDPLVQALLNDEVAQPLIRGT